MRGQTAELGAKRISQNGYEYTKVEVNGKPQWRLSHHLVAEEILGRPLREDERVSFVNSRKDLSPDNIRITLRGQTSVSKRLAQIEARISELEAERDELRSQL
jgi:starvation-inducible outer membrane lipoprotein